MRWTGCRIRPGVYLFYGENPLPLYVGKSINLRDRVASHFCGDWQRETDLRLSQEIRRIEFEETAGEVGALLRESQLVKTLLPAHNHALRRKAESGVLELPADPGPPRYVTGEAIEPGTLAGRYGPFSSRRQARETLRSLADEHALCWTALGLEKRPGPCFARQLRRCAGACVGAETAEEHARAPGRSIGGACDSRPGPAPGWPRCANRSASGERVDVHVLHDWCWLGTARDDGELARIIEAPPRPAFDADIVKLLLRRHKAGALPLRAIPGSDAPPLKRSGSAADLAACAASTSATHAVSFFAYGMCRNSLGPCALECGPSTPVMRNCAPGKCLPSIAMKGIVPPSPIAAAGLP